MSSETTAPQPASSDSPKPRVVSGLRSKQAAAVPGSSPDLPGDASRRGSSTPGNPRQASLPVLELDPRTYDRALDCVHCGLCLPACPTYTQNGLEGDSPRGRIQLMKDLADGRIEATDSVREHLDLCLDCRACETACPSGVKYHELIEETRAKLDTHRSRGWADGLVHAMFFHVFTNPTRLKLALLPPRLLQKLGVWKLLTKGPLAKLLPAQIEKMQQMLPQRGPLWERPLQRRYPPTANLTPEGKPKAVVGVFAGCIGSVLFQHVNRQMIDLLRHFGCEVVVPAAQQCCGAIHHHGGRIEPAEGYARANIDAFCPGGSDEPTVDFIVNNIAGCGAMLKDYAHLLRDDIAYAERAKAFVGKVRDVSELLLELGPPKPTHRVERTVTYHHACHLAHAQKVTEPPIQLLSMIEGLELRPLQEADMCCGAAGTYNLAQPAMARDLAQRKIGHIQKTGAGACVTGNVGCAMQIQSEADRLGVELDAVHPVTLLHEAYFGKCEE